MKKVLMIFILIGFVFSGIKSYSLGIKSKMEKQPFYDTVSLNSNSKINFALGMELFNEEKKQEHRLIIRNNMFFTRDHGILNSENIIFVLNEKNEIYCYPIKPSPGRRTRVSHASFNEKAASAGMFVIFKGRLEFITNECSDYDLNYFQFMQIVEALCLKGYKFKGAKDICKRILLLTGNISMKEILEEIKKPTFFNVHIHDRIPIKMMVLTVLLSFFEEELVSKYFFKPSNEQYWIPKVPICRKKLGFNTLQKKIDFWKKYKDKKVIGIAGSQCSGKTVYVTNLMDQMSAMGKNVLCFDLDEYWKPSIERICNNTFMGENAINMNGLFKFAKKLKALKGNKKYDHIIVLGHFTFYFDFLEKLMDIKIYIDRECKERLSLKIKRETYGYPHQYIRRFFQCQFQQKLYFINQAKKADFYIENYIEPLFKELRRSYMYVYTTEFYEQKIYSRQA